MPVRLERAHNSGAATSNGTTVSATLAADVPVGQVLVAWTAVSAEVSSLSRPGGEPAGWERLAASAYGELWAIRTTTTWGAGSSITATFASSAGLRALAVAEFSGVDVVTRGPGASAAGNVAYGGSLPATVSAGLRAGDLVLAGAYLAGQTGHNTIRRDADTVAGQWAVAATAQASQGLYYPNVTGQVQFKVLTTDSPAQTFDAAWSSGGTEYSAGSRAMSVGVVALAAANDPPNAPALTSMADGGVIDRSRANRAAWTFSDPNPADSQSAFRLYWRPVGASSWAEVYAETPSTRYDFPAGTFDVGDYEWQVRTYDSLGAEGPRSTSGFFTADDPPPGPSITYPTNGQSVDQADHVTWSTPNQDAYRVRRTSPDGATVHYDSGVVADAGARSAALEFPVNGRAERIEVQVRHEGLWSGWVSVDVDVSYAPPPTPVVSLHGDAATGTLLVAITNPPPTDGSPEAAFNRVYIDDGDGEELRAPEVATNATWRYWLPRSGRDYSAGLRVVAVAANGITSEES